MRWFVFSLLFLPTWLFAKQLTFNIFPGYPLNVVNSQIICSSLHANLSYDALGKLETLAGVPFTCMQNPNNPKELTIVFTLKN